MFHSFDAPSGEKTFESAHDTSKIDILMPDSDSAPIDVQTGGFVACPPSPYCPESCGLAKADSSSPCFECQCPQRSSERSLFSWPQGEHIFTHSNSI
ncbi:unnamed protein product [Protopolystoma xenopodis]|uniref:Uncharacterized protein n=1 Tax=Protopolystoma xenopodis TaxID=117903 RepID=A0A3S5FEW1_9PLAT|nr:unnamed protein product [Protopolystoma xenopodis]